MKLHQARSQIQVLPDVLGGMLFRVAAHAATGNDWKPPLALDPDSTHHFLNVFLQRKSAQAPQTEVLQNRAWSLQFFAPIGGVGYNASAEPVISGQLQDPIQSVVVKIR